MLILLIAVGFTLVVLLLLLGFTEAVKYAYRR